MVLCLILLPACAGTQLDRAVTAREALKSSLEATDVVWTPILTEALKGDPAKLAPYLEVNQAIEDVRRVDGLLQQVLAIAKSMPSERSASFYEQLADCARLDVEKLASASLLPASARPLLDMVSAALVAVASGQRCQP